MIRPVAFIAATMAVATPAMAQDGKWKAPPPAWEGVWRGTIGTLPVHVCLNNTPYQDNGSYYYDRHRELIALELSKDRKTWSETTMGLKPSGTHWTITNQGKEKLVGEWKSGGRVLPVLLSRIGPTSKEFEGPCGTLIFQKPRLRPARITETKSTFQGEAIKRLTFRPGPPFDDVEIKSFALSRGGVAVAKVNDMLREILPKPDSTGDWFDCMMANGNAHNTDGEYSDHIEPTLITPRWLAARRSADSYCGGAHPNTFNLFLTFDLASGVDVDPLDWFLPSAVKVARYGSEALKTLTPRFRRALLAGYRPDHAECEGVLAGQENWTVGIERGGLVFWPELPRVVMACSENLKLPIARIAPWLNARGKAVFATLPR